MDRQQVTAFVLFESHSEINKTIFMLVGSDKPQKLIEFRWLCTKYVSMCIYVQARDLGACVRVLFVCHLSAFVCEYVVHCIRTSKQRQLGQMLPISQLQIIMATFIASALCCTVKVNKIKAFEYKKYWNVDY